MIWVHIFHHGILTITRLRALFAEMSELIAVAALDVVHVLGLGALFRHVALLAAVATAARTTTLRAVLAEMTHWQEVLAIIYAWGRVMLLTLVTLATLNTLSGARLGACTTCQH